MTTFRELFEAATHFRFDDGTDCYERWAEGWVYRYDDGSLIPSGTSFWEARGCLNGPGAQWFPTRDEALKAIGKTIGGS